jgi:hypothetical protein
MYKLAGIIPFNDWKKPERCPRIWETAAYKITKATEEKTMP